MLTEAQQSFIRKYINYLNKINICSQSKMIVEVLTTSFVLKIVRWVINI